MNAIHPSTQPSNTFLNPIVSVGMHNDVDDFLSSDLEMSFASTLSISSPSTSPKTLLSVNVAPSPVPMDISPVPAVPVSKVHQSKAKIISRPRALTTVRTFGRELVNHPVEVVPGSLKSETSTQSSKRLQRSALPAEWMSGKLQPDMHGQGFEMPSSSGALSANHDAMDVDMDSIAVPLLDSSPMPKTAVQTDYTNLFFDHASPVRPSTHFPRKRRSVSPERSRYEDSSQAASSSPAPPSPSHRKFERFYSTGMGGGALNRKSSKSSLSGHSHGSLVASKRLRRPTISAIVKSENIPPNSTHSAFPLMETSRSGMEDESTLPAPRRALSAMVPPTNFGSFITGIEDTSSDDISTNLHDMSSPAAQAYAKRQSMKTIRRRDGTEDFRPLTGVTALADREIKPRSPAHTASPSKFLGAGLPSFGDNEAHGKILPCHRVKEDGLMRINCQTLNSLLNGDFDSQIAGYHIIDCRFEYEYNGGHIRSAVNINTAADIEDFFFNVSQSQPLPSCSGDSVKKTILIFHCEFSVKRAPTFAKHLRSKDRAMNNHVYPKIHYPELYILNGGYSQFFKESSVYCEPCAYVTMDDPAYLSYRREDLGQFRKARFGRTKSYAYGDAGAKPLSKTSQPSQLAKPQRNTAPSSGITSLFNAAAAARGRRGASGLSTLDEVGNTSVEDECDGPLGDSPCPPASKNSALRAGLMSRAPLSRAFTLGCTDM